MAWARAFGAKIVLLYVLPEHLPGELSQIGVVFHERRAAKAAEKQLPELVRRYLPTDLTVETRVSMGPPDYTICKVARETDAGLIIMGSHGHSGFKRLLLGSTAERVVGQSTTPVMVVR